MFDPDANTPRINRGKAYLTSEIGGRSMNSRRHSGSDFLVTSTGAGQRSAVARISNFQLHQ
jgi:hypothetical protein